jgi:hypothetical protein
MHADISKHEHEGEPDNVEIAAHYVSAPTSRPDYGAALGDPDMREGRVTLSAAERDHARASGISDELYAANKLKMMRAKKSGLIKDG